VGQSNEVGAIPYEKENNVEYSLFQKQGRITRKALFFRLFSCFTIWLIFHAIYIFWAEANFIKYTEIGGGKIQAGAAQIEMRYKVVQILDFYVIPFILLLFILIQTVKRVHDVNKSGWFLLVPFYNLYLILVEGTDGNNDYGLVPHPEKKSPKYQVNET
jgi:uncharacterized membrane protein YhaH (DUF805 family)